ncbi:TolC family protein [Tellurirhabdus rosea]|uniref:TolC family protein n=1 Tax=Tellurirhabdus rosea TaxID=2674997 RepID=UPI00225640D5|nr:TolC family protein [Tellurirhabdus rosea]
MKRFLILLLLLTTGSAYAQTVLTSVQEAVALASQKAPDLTIARQNRAVQDLQRVSSRAALLPTARAFTNLDYNYALPIQLIPAEFLGGSPGEFRRIQFGVPYNLQAGLEVTAPLLNKPARVDQSLTEQNLQLIDLQNLVLQDDIATQTARFYHAALLTRAAIELARRNVASTDTIVTIARGRLDKGLIEPLEYNRLLSVQLAQLDVVAQNELNFQRNVNQLKFLLGLSLEDSLVLAQRATDWAADDVSPAELNERPGVTLRRAQLDYYRLQLDRERALRLPTLAVYGRFSEQAQRREFNFFDFNEPWFSIGVVGLQFNVPIYSGGARKAGMTRARLRIQQAETELAVERNRMAVDNADVRNSYNQAVRSLDLNRRQFDLSEQNTRIALIKYRAGVYAYDQYLNVFNEALSAQNRYLTTLSNVLVNRTILQIRSSLPVSGRRP